MSDILIPFGLYQATDRLVDVHEVERGLACGCICPSCRLPLMAKQGIEKEWHFAHASRQPGGQRAALCDYSFFLSVRLMVRQQVQDFVTLSLPAYKDRLSQFVDVLDRDIEVAYTIASQREVQLTQVKTEVSLKHAILDILGQVDGETCGIYLSHPGRDKLTGPSALCEDVPYLLNLDLTGLAEAFNRVRAGQGSYLQALTEYLSAESGRYSWVCHPGNEDAGRAASRQLAHKIDRIVTQHRSQAGGHLRQLKNRAMHRQIAGEMPTAVQMSYRDARFECVMCHVQWDGREPDGLVCPKCHSHLFTRVVQDYS